MECGIGNVERRTENRGGVTQKAMRTLTMTREEEANTNVALSDLMVATTGIRWVT